MSKQIALLLDNSGSMFAPVGGANPYTKIHETASGAQQFIQNLIDRMASTSGSQFALSVHRFASTYQLLPGGAQIDSGSGSFSSQLATMEAQIAQIQDEAASQAAVGSLTDLYEAVRRTGDYMIGHNPSFGVPGSRVMVLFSDGIQTIAHGGGTTQQAYEGDTGLTFANLLSGRSIKFIGWGVGTDALGTVLQALTDDAVVGGTNPVSSSKVLFPYTAQPNCTTTIVSAAHAVVDNNGILSLRPASRPASGLLWEQFSLPSPAPVSAAVAVTAVPMVNHADFEVDVDDMTRELILSLVGFRPASPSLMATSPSGQVANPGSPGTRSIMGPTVRTLKIPNPEPGTWRVRVSGEQRRAALYDLMARGVCRELSLAVSAAPHAVLAPGEVSVTATPRLDGKALGGKLQATALVLGGDAYDLAQQDDGSFSGKVAVPFQGRNPIRVELQGKLDDGRSLHRIEFAVVQVGPARDPRFELTPALYEQGSSYSVTLTLHDASFGHASSLRMGTGISVTRLDVQSEHQAVAEIQVAPDAFVGTREAVLYAPMAESLGVVRVVPGQGGQGQVPPGAGHHEGRICCLRFDASGQLIGVALCDGPTLCVHHDERIQQLLETARDKGLPVRVHVDDRGCLVGVDICR